MVECVSVIESAASGATKNETSETTEKPLPADALLQIKVGIFNIKKKKKCFWKFPLMLELFWT